MALTLIRPRQPRQLISLVPMVDVMLILLVFFMVTSTYLNLDMIPMVEIDEDEQTATTPANTQSASLFIRLGADDRTYIWGQALSQRQLADTVGQQLSENPLLTVVLLPSLRATTQGLVTTMDTLALAGATRIRVLQLEATAR